MKRSLLFPLAVLAASLSPAPAALPEFNSTAIGVPPLALAQQPTKAPPASPLLAAPDRVTVYAAPARVLAQDCGMPILLPNPNVDHAMIVKTPNPAIDYKMIVRSPARAVPLAK